MTARQITQKITECPSYLKWSVERLCAKFNCSYTMMNKIVTELKPLKRDYINSFTVPTPRNNVKQQVRTTTKRQSFS